MPCFFQAGILPVWFWQLSTCARGRQMALIRGARLRGALAQLVERLVRNEKVSGSNPLCSTTLDMQPEKLSACLMRRRLAQPQMKAG